MLIVSAPRSNRDNIYYDQLHKTVCK